MKILVLDTVHPILFERISSHGFTMIDATQLNREACIALLGDISGIVVRSRFPMDASFLSKAPHLKFIARSGAGMENIDVAYCSERSIQLFNAPEGNRNAVGEHALGMLLALMNHFIQGDAEVRKGIWDREGNRGEEIEGKTIGIIGYGNNGREFAKKLRGFDCSLLVYDKYLSEINDSFVEQVSLTELYKRCDVISFHIPQNAETIYWANESFFNQLSKPIYLLNLSRGKIVETKALLRAIDTGIVKGAALDVLEYEKSSFEKIDDHPDFNALLVSTKVIFTPHVAGWTVESYEKLSEVLAEKIIDWKIAD
jgi:D-3-phosphoglycerate dehydrogenase